MFSLLSIALNDALELWFSYSDRACVPFDLLWRILVGIVALYRNCKTLDCVTDVHAFESKTEAFLCCAIFVSIYLIYSFCIRIWYIQPTTSLFNCASLLVDKFNECISLFIRQSSILFNHSYFFRISNFCENTFFVYIDLWAKRG